VSAKTKQGDMPWDMLAQESGSLKTEKNPSLLLCTDRAKIKLEDH
jgi:hypothetical protein